MGLCEPLWAFVNCCGHVRAVVGVCEPLWASVSHCGHV